MALIRTLLGAVVVLAVSVPSQAQTAVAPSTEAPPTAGTLPPEGPASPAPATGVAAAPEPSPAMPGHAALPDPGHPPGPGLAPGPEVTFTALAQSFSLVRDSAAYVAASEDAPQMYPLRAGTALKAVERSTDGKWIITITEDGQAAFLPTVDLGPYDPGRAPKPDLPEIVAGTAQVDDTATLRVDGRTLTLAGILPETGRYARQMQDLIKAQGRQVRCTPQGAAFLCKLPDGMDIARAALFNGAAQPSEDASDDYRRQADAARTARRGIWQTATAALGR